VFVCGVERKREREKRETKLAIAILRKRARKFLLFRPTWPAIIEEEEKQIKKSFSSKRQPNCALCATPKLVPQAAAKWTRQKQEINNNRNKLVA